MSTRLAAALLASGLIVAAPVYSQDAPRSAEPVTTQERPVFRITVVGRTVSAVNYRPRSGKTQIDFAGTALMPDARGHATIEGERGYTKIDAHFNRLKAPTTIGPEYLTYVLWAITPEGRANNLGEVQWEKSPDDLNIKVTTELQSFALVLTAEPYFAVSQPSDVVVAENIIRPEKFASLKDGTEGRFEIVDAKYELLKRGSYLFSHEPSDLKVKPLDPGAPLDLAEARNAVAIARLAGADRFAAETFTKATTLLDEAEAARANRKSGKDVQQPAREAVQAAEDARLIGLKRQEELYLQRERELAAQREADANARAQAEVLRRQQLEAEANARAAQLEAERLAADSARAAAERERLDAERQKAEAEAARLAADRERAAADAARAAAEQARLAAEAQASQARAAAEQAEREQAALRQRLRDQLNVVLETRETARGLIVNLSDVLFDFNRAELKPGAREKLAKIAGIILAHPGLKMSVEGHADAIGSDDYNQRLSERRAESVHSFLETQGVAKDVVTSAGFGESRPVATNGTAEGRQQNRRVEIVVSGEPIGVS